MRELFELRHQLPVPAQRQVGVDPRLGRLEQALLEHGSLRHGPRFEHQVGERRAAHEAECVAEKRGCLLRLGSRRLADEPLEPVEIDLAVLDDQFVSASPPDDAFAAERPPEMGHVDLKDLRGRRGRVVGPDRVDQPVVRDRPAALEEQHREERPFLRRPEWDRPAVVLDLEGAQDAELHRATLTARECT